MVQWECPRSKLSWKAIVEAAINSYWNDRLQSVVPLYPSLKWLTRTKKPNRTLHSLIMSAENLREVPSIAVHLKIVTGTYILQSNRASFDPTCLLCKTGAETLTHFLLHCAILESIREPILKDIKYILRHSDIDFNNSEILLQLLTDCSAILDTETVSEFIFHVRRLCHALHVERYQRLSIVPRRKRKAKTKKKGC